LAGSVPDGAPSSAAATPRIAPAAGEPSPPPPRHSASAALASGVSAWLAAPAAPPSPMAGAQTL